MEPKSSRNSLIVVSIITFAVLGSVWLNSWKQQSRSSANFHQRANDLFSSGPLHISREQVLERMEPLIAETITVSGFRNCSFVEKQVGNLESEPRYILSFAYHPNLLLGLSELTSRVDVAMNNDHKVIWCVWYYTDL